MKFVTTRVLIGVIASNVAFGLLAAASARAQTLEVAGGLTFYKEVLEPNAQTFKDRTGLNIKFAGPTTGLGVFLLIQGKAKAAMALDTLDEAIKQAHTVAKEQRTALVVPKNLVFKQFSTDKLAIVVNKKNPVTAISRAQFKGIAAGKITNWKQLGGPDLAIKVITGTPTTATRLVAERQLLDGAAFSAGATEVRTTAEEVKRVSHDPGAIGIISSRYIDAPGAQIKGVDGPSASRPWGVVTIGKPSADVQKLIDFLLSAEGQRLLQQ